MNAYTEIHYKRRKLKVLQLTAKERKQFYEGKGARRVQESLDKEFKTKTLKVRFNAWIGRQVFV